MRIYGANNVFIEVTRRCNMCCAHCLRGDAESIDIQEKYIDMALAENSALNDCVPSNRLRAYPQQWLPGESNS